jgi:hypothetical protein
MTRWPTPGFVGAIRPAQAGGSTSAERSGAPRKGKTAGPQGRDRRTSKRSQARRAAWLDFGDRQARCFIWDISQGGARLSVDNPVGEIPCAFSLLLSKDGHVRSHCEVIWVDQQYIGVRFVSPAP